MRFGSRTQLAWLAGFIDGEGTISVVRRAPRKGAREGYDLAVHVGNTNQDSVEYAAAVGGTQVRGAVKTLPSGRKWYYVRWCGKSALGILQAIQPFLVAKHEQCDLAIEFAKTIRYGADRCKQHSPHVIATRQLIVLRLRRLKTA